MIALALLLASAAPSVLDAERAFAKLAQDKGQWTAFRATAAPDAVMFVPQPVKAQDWLKDRKDPPKSVRWQPTEAWMSCDGSLAVTTGNWQREKTVGYFTTIWKRQADGDWKWVLDSGDELKVPRPANADPTLVMASCGVVAKGKDANYFGSRTAEGVAKDGTLSWFSELTDHQSRVLHVRLWEGSEFIQVIDDETRLKK